MEEPNVYLEVRTRWRCWRKSERDAGWEERRWDFSPFIPEHGSPLAGFLADLYPDGTRTNHGRFQ
jgi:hypothetical protein